MNQIQKTGIGPQQWIQRLAIALMTAGMVLPIAIAPRAWAQAAPLTLNLPRRQGEDYGRLVRRAEEAAGRAAQQIFSNNPVNEISLTVVGENQNLAAPLLTLQVTRADWLRSPNPRQWSTYYRTAEGLLQLQPTATATQSAPADAPSASPTAAPTATTPDQPTTTSGQPASAEPGQVSPSSATSTPSQPSDEVPTSTPPEINIPAAPAGQLGLPRSVLR